MANLSFYVENFNELLDEYSDCFKDVHGFRPRGFKFNSPEELKEAYELLSQEREELFLAEQARKERSIKAFEALIADLINSGANSRKTAIKWLEQAESFDDPQSQGNNYLEWRFDLPYGYLQGA